MATTTIATLSRRRPPQIFGKRVAVAMLLALALGGLASSPVSALPTGVGVATPGGGSLGVAPPDPCLPAPQIVKFTATPSTVMLGENTALNWDVQLPSAGCLYTLALSGPVGFSLTNLVPQWTYPVKAVPVQVQAGQMLPTGDIVAPYTLTLSWGPSGDRRTSATVLVIVKLPADPDPRFQGRRKVTIDATTQSTALFIKALGTPNTTVVVDVDLDLSPFERIAIAEGVILRGGRTARPGVLFQPGPRLYTTSHPEELFEVQGDRVRITGVRIEGPEMGQYEGDAAGPVGILVTAGFAAIDHNAHQCDYTQPAWQSIEIDHNELSGWSHAAIRVTDECLAIVVQSYFDNGSRSIIYDHPFEPVHIHDNYIHHNQHIGGNGYGVAVAAGAHALIERNVFDYNRHAISEDDGGGRTGYRAYHNLVLAHGGLHDCWAAGTYCSYTHQFDMHGNMGCQLHDHYCGIAGHDYDIRYNSFLYTSGPAIKVRGTPQLQPYGAVVASNVFALDRDPLHVVVFIGVPMSVNGASLMLWGVVQTTESGLLVTDDNLMEGTPWTATKSCDFDGDGRNDLFLATGQTWWYCPASPGDGTCETSPGGGKPTWIYLHTSTLGLHDVTLGYFDADRLCDVFGGGRIFSGGTDAPPVPGRL